MKKNYPKVKFLLLIIGVCITAAFSTMSVKAYDEDYGVAAYEYLKIIDAEYPYRVTNPNYEDESGKNAAGAWIQETLESFGYEVETFYFNHYGKDVISYAATKPGESEKILAIGAHYDSALDSEGNPTKGVEDNGTGISLVLELAKRFYEVDTYYTLEFCFFDGEETEDSAGAYSYIDNRGADQIVAYMNLDTIGAGDYPYVYGGAWEDDVLVRDWVYNMAKEVSYQCGIELMTIPETERYGKPPVRTLNSDQMQFNGFGIPYVYFESNRWYNEEGACPQTSPQMYNSALEVFADTNGKIIHTTVNEDLAVLESKVPGRIKERLTTFSIVASQMILSLDDTSAEKYKTLIIHEKEELTTEEETSTEEDSSESTTEKTTEVLTTEEERIPEEKTIEEITPIDNEEERPMDLSKKIIFGIWILSGVSIIVLIALLIIDSKQHKKESLKGRHKKTIL